MVSFLSGTQPGWFVLPTEPTLLQFSLLPEQLLCLFSVPVPVLVPVLVLVLPVLPPSFCPAETLTSF